MSSAENYYEGANNDDCTPNHIIETESECRKAASASNREFGGTLWEQSKWPAGCYINNGRTYFNENLDFGWTYPKNNSAGLCRGGSIYS